VDGFVQIPKRSQNRTELKAVGTKDRYGDLITILTDISAMRMMVTAADAVTMGGKSRR